MTCGQLLKTHTQHSKVLKAPKVSNFSGCDMQLLTIEQVQKEEDVDGSDEDYSSAKDPDQQSESTQNRGFGGKDVAQK